MSEQTIKLTVEEMSNLQKVYADKKRGAVISIVFIAVLLLLFTILPDKYTSWLTFHHSSTPNENLIQEWGIGWSMLFLLFFFGLISYSIIRTKKIFPLKKDLKEGEKLEVDVVITAKNCDTRYDYYYIRVSGESLKSKKVTLSKEQYEQFTEGQKLTIDVYKNSMILVSSVPK